MLREVEEEISLPPPTRKGQGLEDALRRAVRTHPFGMARHILRHPRTFVLHDVRVWAIGASASDLSRIRQRLDGIREGGMEGLHRENDVLSGPHAVLYADAVREAIRILPPWPPQANPLPTALTKRRPSRRRWRVHPSPSLEGRALPKGIVCEGGVVRFLRDLA